MTDRGPAPRVAVTLEQCWHRVPGGTARVALAATAALAERGDVNLVGVTAHHRDPAPEGFRPAIPTVELPLGRRALYEAWHAVARPRVESVAGPIDVVHGTGVAVPGTRLPLVMTVNDLAFLDHDDHATRHGHRFFRRATELARRRAALVLVPSTATRDRCLAEGFDPARLRLVPYGVDPAPAIDDADIARTMATHHLTHPYVLFVGTVEPRKNLATLLAAFAQLDAPQLDLVLVGAEGWNEDLYRHLSGTRNPGRVRRLGFVGDADRDALYAGARAVAYPSRFEGFGLPVLEAMAAGVPVVSSATTATAEVAGDAALLIDPDNTAELAAALHRLTTDDALAAELVEAGRARAATYTWERTAALTAEAYREVAGLDGPPADGTVGDG